MEKQINKYCELYIRMYNELWLRGIGKNKNKTTIHFKWMSGLCAEVYGFNGNSMVIKVVKGKEKKEKKERKNSVIRL